MDNNNKNSFYCSIWNRFENTGMFGKWTNLNLNICPVSNVVFIIIFLVKQQGCKCKIVRYRGSL